MFDRPTTGFERSLYGLPVVVNANMPAKTVLIADKSAVVSATGNLLVARSDDAAFDRDAVMVRMTMRQGHAVAYPKRLQVIKTA